MGILGPCARPLRDLPVTFSTTWQWPRGACCGELSTGEYHAQYERSSGWLWTGGLEARQGVGTQDWGSPYTTLKQNGNPSSHPQRRGSGLGLNTLLLVDKATVCANPGETRQCPRRGMPVPPVT